CARSRITKGFAYW
nr:immunoglobulin heavy chain junction region [Mus musculus]